MNHAHYVGRVGALAVALGVGVAVAVPSPAWADDATTPASAESDGPSDSAPEARVAEPDGVDESGEPQPAAEDDDDEGSLPEVDPAAGSGADEPAQADLELDPIADDEPAGLDPEPASGDPAPAPADPAPAPADPQPVSEPATGSRSHPPTGSPSPEPDPPEPVSDEISERVDTPTDTRRAGFVTAADEPGGDSTVIVTPVTAHPVPLRPPSPVAALTALAAVPATLVKAATGLVAAVLSPLWGSGLSGAPTTPPQSPVLWVVLGWVRRQLFNSTPTLTPGPASTDLTTGLLTGDLGGTDADGDPLSYVVVRGPANGTLTLNPGTGTYTYAPRAGFTGKETFVIAVSDHGPDGLFGFLKPYRGHTSVSRIVIDIPAEAATPGYVVDGIDHGSGVVTGHLNLTDSETGAVTVTVTSGPTLGTATVDADGRFVYRPTPLNRARAAYFDDGLVDSFTVTVSEGVGATRTVTVAPAVDPSDNALAYVVPLPEGKSYYQLRNATVDPVTGRVYGALYFYDYNNVAGGRVPIYRSLVAISSDGTAVTTARARADTTDAAVIRVDPVTGTGYLTTVFEDAATGSTTTYVSVIDDQGNTAVHEMAGTAQGGVVVNPRTGRAYQVTRRDLDGQPSTEVLRFDRGGAALGAESTAGAAVGAIVVDPVTGVDVLTTERFDIERRAYVTNLTVFTAEGVLRHTDLAGRPFGGGVVVNPKTRVLYQVTGAGSFGQGNATTYLVALDEHGAIADTVTVAGTRLSPAQVNPVTGTTYLLVAPAPGEVAVRVIAADGATSVIDGLHGTADEVVVHPVTGTAYLVSGNLVPGHGLTVIRPDGTVTTADLPGSPTAPVVVNRAVDAAFITSGSTLMVGASDGVVRVMPGSLYSSPAFDNAGHAYVTTTVDGDTVVTVIAADGAVVRSVEFAGAPRGTVVNAADGTLYVATVGALDDTVLYVVTPDGGMHTHTVPGQPAVIFSTDPANPYTSARVVIDPVTGIAALLTETITEEPGSFDQTLTVISADGATASTVLERRVRTFDGGPVQDIEVNPLTGAFYLVTNEIVDNQFHNAVTMVFDGDTVIRTDNLWGEAVPDGLLFGPSGIVYQTSTAGVWVVDADPDAVHSGQQLGQAL